MKWLKLKSTYHIPQHLNQELRLSGLLMLYGHSKNKTFVNADTKIQKIK